MMKLRCITNKQEGQLLIDLIDQTRIIKLVNKIFDMNF